MFHIPDIIILQAGSDEVSFLPSCTNWQIFILAIQLLIYHVEYKWLYKKDYYHISSISALAMTGSDTNQYPFFRTFQDKKRNWHAICFNNHQKKKYFFP